MMLKRQSLLLHPVFLFALGTLILNDHYLKSHYAGWVTGKLSDFAGLVVLPILICALLPTRNAGRKLIWIMHGLVGMMFVLWKMPLVHGVIAGFGEATGLPVPSVTPDLSDLAALFVLPLSAAIVLRSSGAQKVVAGPAMIPWRARIAHCVILTTAVFAVMATTRPWNLYSVVEEQTEIRGISAARFLFVVERALREQNFVILAKHSFGDGRYGFVIEPGHKCWKPAVVDTSQFVYRFYGGELYVSCDSATGRIDSVKVRLNRRATSAKEFTEENIIVPVRRALVEER